MLDYFPFPQGNADKYYTVGMSERERRIRWWIAPCRLDSFDVMKHTGICSVHFEGGAGLTKLNPVPSIFGFPRHLQRKAPKSWRRKQRKETPQTSKNTKVFTARKKKTQKKNKTLNRNLGSRPVRLEQVGISNSFTFPYQLRRNTHLVSSLVSDFHGKFMSFDRH